MLLNKSYGYANLELSVPMLSDGICLCDQTIYSCCYSQISGGQKLSLDDNFTKYLDFDTKGRKITIAQLLDTSGLAQARVRKNLCK
jgi:hypothetical protein